MKAWELLGLQVSGMADSYELAELELLKKDFPELEYFCALFMELWNLEPSDQVALATAWNEIKGLPEWTLKNK